MTLKIVLGSLLLFLYGSRLLRFSHQCCAAPEHFSCLLALPSAPTAFSADGLANLQSFLDRQEYRKIVENIGGEVLRYALISAQEPHKIGGRSARRRET